MNKVPACKRPISGVHSTASNTLWAYSAGRPARTSLATVEENRRGASPPVTYRYAHRDLTPTSRHEGAPEECVICSIPGIPHLDRNPSQHANTACFTRNAGLDDALGRAACLGQVANPNTGTATDPNVGSPHLDTSQAGWDESIDVRTDCLRVVDAAKGP